MLIPLSGLFFGCIQFQDRPLNPAESAFRIEARTLSSEGLREFIESVTGRESRWPSQTWDVDRLTLVAMYYHTETEAARLLGIHRSQLYVKLTELRIVPEEESPLPEEREHS